MDEVMNGFFTGNARITMPNGFGCAISRVKKGDKVMSWRRNDDGDHEMCECEITGVSKKEYSGELVVGYAMDGKDVVLMPSSTPAQEFAGFNGGAKKSGEIGKDFMAFREKFTPGGKSVPTSISGLDMGVIRYSGTVYHIDCDGMYIVDGFLVK